MKAGESEALKKLMRRAIKQAEKAAAIGEVPIGSLVVQGDLFASRPQVIALAHNLTHSKQDPAGHAELLALRKAAKKKGNWRLSDCTLIVTLEPCSMCAGASVLSRIGKIVYGAADPKAGACGSALQVANHPKLNHRPPIIQGIEEEACSQLLKDFFKARRQLLKNK